MKSILYTKQPTFNIYAEFLFTYLEISIVIQRTILQMQLAYALIQVDITQTFQTFYSNNAIKLPTMTCN